MSELNSIETPQKYDVARIGFDTVAATLLLKQKVEILSLTGMSSPKSTGDKVLIGKIDRM